MLNNTNSIFIWITEGFFIGLLFGFTLGIKRMSELLNRRIESLCRELAQWKSAHDYQKQINDELRKRVEFAEALTAGDAALIEGLKAELATTQFTHPIHPPNSPTRDVRPAN